MKRVLPVVLIAAFGFVGCSKGSDSESGGNSPTAPTPPATPTQTRVISLEGDLNFGDVLEGSSADKLIRVVNRGNST